MLSANGRDSHHDAREFLHFTEIQRSESLKYFVQVQAETHNLPSVAVSALISTPKAGQASETVGDRPCQHIGPLKQGKRDKSACQNNGR